MITLRTEKGSFIFTFLNRSWNISSYEYDFKKIPCNYTLINDTLTIYYRDHYFMICDLYSNNAFMKSSFIEHDFEDIVYNTLHPHIFVNMVPELQPFETSLIMDYVEKEKMSTYEFHHLDNADLLDMKLSFRTRKMLLCRLFR